MLLNIICNICPTTITNSYFFFFIYRHWLCPSLLNNYIFPMTYLIMFNLFSNSYPIMNMLRLRSFYRLTRFLWLRRFNWFILSRLILNWLILYRLTIRRSNSSTLTIWTTIWIIISTTYILILNIITRINYRNIFLINYYNRCWLGTILPFLPKIWPSGISISSATFSLNSISSSLFSFVSIAFTGILATSLLTISFSPSYYSSLLLYRH